MEYFKQIIIITTRQITIPNAFIINEKITLVDDAHLIYQNENYGFDYLIFTDPNLIINFTSSGIIEENGLPITNFFGQTIYSNIYFVNIEQIELTIQNIFDNE